MSKKSVKHLPGNNCGACGYPRCDEFWDAVSRGKVSLSDCKVLLQERHRKDRDALERFLAKQDQKARRKGRGFAPSQPAGGKLVGLIDGYEADFVLKPLPGEPACREILFPITPGRSGPGDVIRYRPLGCPIPHFARVLEKRDGLFVIHVVGPRHRLGGKPFPFTDIGLCMVIGFEGQVQGALPAVGDTVRFKPEACMMQKVHSGVVVKCEGRAVLLEGIDLKVWAPPVKYENAKKFRS